MDDRRHENAARDPLGDRFDSRGSRDFGRRVYVNPEALRLERLVNAVKTQLLLRPIPMTTAAELAAWADERARNIIAGLQDELKELPR